MSIKETKYYLADIKELTPYINNARTHDDKQIAQIVASIKEFGFLSPIMLKTVIRRLSQETSSCKFNKNLTVANR